MRELVRLTVFFVSAVLAMSLAYGAGFVTAVRMPELLPDGPALHLIRRVGADFWRSTPPTGATPEVQVPDPGPADFAVFWEAYRQIQSDALLLPEDVTDFTYGAIRGSLRALDDPFTVFTDPAVTEVQRPDLESSFEGIGAYVTSNESGQLVIQTPMRGQPAEKAGIMAGDIVLKVDDRDIAGMDVEDAVLLIRGPKGTTVELTILRKGEPKPLVIAVVRDKIEIPSVSDVRLLDDMDAPQIGYVELNMFASETRDELTDALDELQDDGARAIILDLRNNPGGFLSTAIDVASQFVGDGVIVYQEDRTGRRLAENAKQGGRALDIPLVVLVNGGSASAAEIVAGAIRDYKRGVLVGDNTFGKGSVQNVHDLADQSQLRVTVAAWLTPSGRQIHRRGINPDVRIEITAEDVGADRDPQLDRAVAEAQALLEPAR